MSKNFLTAAILTLIISNPANANAAADTYTIDRGHTTIGFSVRHMVISNVKGQFNKFVGEFQFDPKAVDLKSASIKIDVGSIDTNERKRDKHLRGPDFLDVDKHRTITFKLVSCDNKGGGKLNVTGDITIRGVTKTINLTGEFLGAIKDPWGNYRAGFSASGEISRKDFGIVYNRLLETGGMVVDDKVKLIIEVEGVKAKKK